MPQLPLLSGESELSKRMKALGVAPEHILPMEPVQLHGLEKDDQPALLSDLARKLGAEHAEHVLIIDSRLMLKNGIEGHHTVLVRRYHEQFKQALTSKIVYPDMMYDKNLNHLIIAEHAFDLGVVLGIARQYFTHILIQQDDDSVLVLGQPTHITPHQNPDVAYPLLRQEYTFTPSDLLDAYASLYPQESVKRFELFHVNTDSTPEWVAIDTLTAHHRHLATRHGLIRIKTYITHTLKREFVFCPETGLFHELEDQSPSSLRALDTFWLKAITRHQESVIINDYGLAMPRRYTKDHLLDHLKDQVHFLFLDVEPIMVDRAMQACKFMPPPRYLAQYINRYASISQPQKQAEPKGLHQPNDRMVMLWDHQALHDLHRFEAVDSLIVEMAYGFSRKSHHFHQCSSLQRVYDPAFYLYGLFFTHALNHSKELNLYLNQLVMSEQNLKRFCGVNEIIMDEYYSDLLELFCREAELFVQSTPLVWPMRTMELANVVQQFVVHHWLTPRACYQLNLRVNH